MTGLLVNAFDLQRNTLVDSALASTREYWRRKVYGATEQESRDPRPFATVISDRAA